MWKRFLMFSALVVVLSSFVVADVGDQYCSWLSSFTQRCVVQESEELRLSSLGLVGYGEVCWGAMSKSNKLALVAELQFKEGLESSRTKLATAGLMPTTFESKTETVHETFFDEEKKQLVNYSVPALYNLDYKKPGCFNFIPEKDMTYSIGFGTANFTTVDFINGTCDTCSIDVSLELTNTHNSTEDRTGLVGEWLFTDYAFDTAGAGNDGTIVGANCTGVTGKVNAACSFDGINDVVDVGNNANLGSDEGTWMVWMKRASDQTGAKGFMGREAPAVNNGESWFQFSALNQLSFALSNSSSELVTSPGVAISQNVWYHAAATWGSNGMKLYVNGVEEATNAYTGGNNAATWNLVIGARRTDASFPFNGTVDEVGVWNRALTGNEINKTYGGGNGNTSWIGTNDQLNNGSVSYWRLDGNANDTRSANDGIVHGATHKHERYEFDGVNDYIEIQYSSILNLSSAATLAAWVKLANGTGAGQRFTVVEKGSGDKYMIYVDQNNLGIWSGFKIESTFNYNKIGENGVGEWHFVASTFDGSAIRTYYDGKLVGTEANAGTTGDIASDTTNVSISRLGRPFNGAIDEVQIWNKELTATEIEMIYNNSLYKRQDQTTRTGTYTSIPFSNTSARVTWTTINWTGTLETGDMTVETRTSSDATNWQTWRTCTQPTFHTGASNVNTTLETEVMTLGGCTGIKSTTPTECNSTVLDVEDAETYTFLTSMDLQKTAGGGSDAHVSARITVDGVTIEQESIVTLTAANEYRVAGLSPIEVQLTSGSHEVALDVWSDRDTLDIENIDMVAIEKESRAGAQLPSQVIKANFNFTNTVLANTYNWTITRTQNAPEFIFAKATSTGTEEATVEGRIRDSGVSRHIASAGEMGSAGIFVISTKEEGTHEEQVFAKTTAGTIKGNITTFDIQLKDDSNNLINSFNTTDTSTTITANKTYTAGTHAILNYTVKNYESNKYFLTYAINLVSTSGTQTVTVKANSTSILASQCESSKRRTVDDASRGSIYGFLDCEGLNRDTSYTFSLYLTVPAGETAQVFDEFLGGAESNDLAEATTGCTVTSTPNTYLQYRLNLKTNRNSYTPSITNTILNYLNCIETWMATGWVENGSYQYRNVNDSSSCGTTFFKPADVELITDFFAGIAIIIGSVMFFMYKSSQELDERHWIIKMLLFYGTLAMGWAVTNVALRMAVDLNASSAIVTGIEVFYQAYTWIGVVVVMYLGLRFIVFTFEKFRSLSAKAIGEDEMVEEEQAW